MAIKLIIKGTPVELPESGQSPNWAPGIIEAIQALSEAVNSISGTYDVAPQVQDIDAFPLNQDIPINNLIFPSEDVLAATVFYSVTRRTSTPEGQPSENITEAGTLQIVYNESQSRWEMQREFVGGAKIDFSINNFGQILFSTRQMTGEAHVGRISYRAISILNT
jgi:hypothetical protein